MPVDEQRLTLSLLFSLLRECFINKTMVYGCSWLGNKYEGERYWGYREDWYDGPIHQFGFYFFHFWALEDNREALIRYIFRRSWYKIVYGKNLK